MNSYQNLPPQERMVIVAKIYHHIWYSEHRYNELMNLLNEWDQNPTKEAKFLNEITNGTELKESELR
ncbi:MAG: hypothetical protein ACOVOQ_15390 [Flavobacterium sp.]|jgi:hypothetical protein